MHQYKRLLSACQHTQFGTEVFKVRFKGWNGPFALTGHMVQNPPYWMAKECGILHWDIENKGKSSFTGWNSFVFESDTFFCHPVWRILYHVTS